MRILVYRGKTLNINECWMVINVKLHEPYVVFFIIIILCHRNEQNFPIKNTVFDLRRHMAIQQKKCVMLYGHNKICSSFFYSCN